MPDKLPPPDPTSREVLNAPPAPELNPKALSGGEAIVGSLIETEQSREPLISPERLKDMVLSSGFGVHAYIDRSRTPSGVLLDGSQQLGFNTAMSHPGMNRIMGHGGGMKPINDALLETLLADGVTEAVSVSYSEQPVSAFTDQGLSSDESAVLISYRTLGGERPEGLYNMSRKAQENYKAFSRRSTAADPMFQAALLMPRSMAEEFLEAARQDPQLFRELMEAAVTERLQDQNMWDGEKGIRPGFEQWHEYNQGVDKIALQHNQPGTPRAPLETLEFSASY